MIDNESLDPTIAEQNETLEVNVSDPQGTDQALENDQVLQTGLGEISPEFMNDPYGAELAPASYRGILAGHRRYFPEDWPPAHLEFVRRQYGQTLSGEWPRLTMVRRLQGGMLYNDPVVYDWQHIESKALVLGGEEDGDS